MKLLVIGDKARTEKHLPDMPVVDKVDIVVAARGTSDAELLELAADADFIINTTPCGMFPHPDAAPLDLSRLPACAGVLDLIYNPPVTLLMRQARERGIPAFNGLYMLVAQARRSAELFTGQPIPEERTEEIFLQLSGEEY